MKNSDLYDLKSFFLSFNLVKIKDKELRHAISNNFIVTNNLIDGINARIKTLSDQYFKGFSEEAASVQKLRELLSKASDAEKAEIEQQILSHKEYLDAESKLTENAQEILDEGPVLNYTKMSEEKLFEEAEVLDLKISPILYSQLLPFLTD